MILKKDVRKTRIIKKENNMFCSSCSTDLPESDFAPSVVIKGSGWCRDCRSSYDKQKREANPKFYKKRDEKYYQDNKDVIIERQKEYNSTHVDKQKQKEYNKEYYRNKKGD